MAITDKLSAIADAIRAKTGESGTMKLEQMPGKIAGISTGITPSGNINITDTQQTDVTNYATAQVVDANLTAENIASGVTVLGIVGTHQGGGGELPQLHAPTISIVEDTLTITNPSTNGDFVTAFGGYANGVSVGAIPVSSNPLDLTSLGFPAGDYTLTATCKGTNFAESEQSNSLAYTNIFYNISSVLVGCTSNNSTVSLRKGKPYTATISAIAGYTLVGATVSISMGGTDVTDTVYHNGSIDIVSLTGDLNISITANALSWTNSLFLDGTSPYRTLSKNTNEQYITYLNGKYIAGYGGYDSTLGKSVYYLSYTTDLTNWTEVESQVAGIPDVYFGGYYYMFKKKSVDNKLSISVQKSSDLANWESYNIDTSLPTASSSNLLFTVLNGKLIWLLQGTSYVITSDDGVNVSYSNAPRKFSNNGSFAYMLFNDTFYFKADDDYKGSNELYKTADGSVWETISLTKTTEPDKNTFYVLNGAMYVCCKDGNEKIVLKSTDGTIFSVDSDATNPSGGSRFCSSGASVIKYSTENKTTSTTSDGKIWKPGELSYFPMDMIFANGHFVAFGRESTSYNDRKYYLMRY